MNNKNDGCTIPHCHFGMFLNLIHCAVKLLLWLLFLSVNLCLTSSFLQVIVIPENPIQKKIYIKTKLLKLMAAHKSSYRTLHW